MSTNPAFTPARNSGSAPPPQRPILDLQLREGNLLYIALHLPSRPVSATCMVPLLLRHTRRTTCPDRIVDSIGVACYVDYNNMSYTCSRTPLGKFTGLLLPADGLTRVHMSCSGCWKLCVGTFMRDKNSNVIWRIDERVSRPSNEPGSVKGLTVTLGNHMQDRIMCYHLLSLLTLQTATLASGTSHLHPNIHTLRTLLCHLFREGLTYAVLHGASLWGTACQLVQILPTLH